MLNDWIILWRLVLAAALSGVIGFEREFHGRAAGFRTHILLCIGSALTMLTSIHIFEVYYSKVALDPARIAAGVITGIGFLGAGAIMHYKSSIRGLTTAASLWVVAGIGLAVGSGLYFGAVLTTILTMIALMFFGRLEHIMIRKDWYRTVVVDMKEGTQAIKAVRAVLSEYRTEITDFEIDHLADGSGLVLKLGLKLYTANYADQIIAEIGKVDGVKHARWEAE